MTDKAYIPATDVWAVQVTMPRLGGPEARNRYYSAFADANDAVDAVRAYCGVGLNDLVEAKEKLSPNSVALLVEREGLTAGNVIPWVEMS